MELFKAVLELEVEATCPQEAALVAIDQARIISAVFLGIKKS